MCIGTPIPQASSVQCFFRTAYSCAWRLGASERRQCVQMLSASHKSSKQAHRMPTTMAMRVRVACHLLYGPLLRRSYGCTPHANHDGNASVSCLPFTAWTFDPLVLSAYCMPTMMVLSDKRTACQARWQCECGLLARLFSTRACAFIDVACTPHAKHVGNASVGCLPGLLLHTPFP